MAITFTNGISGGTNMKRVEYAGYDFIPHDVEVIEQVIWDSKNYVIGKCGSLYVLYRVRNNYHGEDTGKCGMVFGFRIFKHNDSVYRVHLDYVHTHAPKPKTYRADRFLKNWLWFVSQFADEVIRYRGI